MHFYMVDLSLYQFIALKYLYIPMTSTIKQAAFRKNISPHEVVSKKSIAREH